MRKATMCSFLFVLVAGALVLSACGGGTAATPTAAATAAPTARPTTAAPTAAPTATTAPTARPTTAPPTTAPTAQATRAATPTPGVAPSPTVAAPGRYGGVLRIWTAADPGGIDPGQDNTSIRSISLYSLAYNGLLMWDPSRPDDQVPIPDLAESWNVSGGGTVWTYKLREGIKFHDGKPLTSEDVKFTYLRSQKPPTGIQSPWASMLDGITAIETPDARTVVFRLSTPKALLLGISAWNQHLIMPKHILEADQKGLRTKAVGTGPFILDEWKQGVAVGFSKNPNYFKKGRPYLDGMRHVIIADSSAQFAALRTGQIDMAGYGSRGLSTTEANQLKRDVPKFQVWQYQCGCLGQLLFNTTQAPWNDVRVRRSAALVQDGKFAIDIAYEGVGAVGGFMPMESSWSLPADELKRDWPVVRGPTAADITKAKALLAEAGYPKGFKTPYMQGSTATYEEQMLAHRDALGKIGIELEVTIRQFPAQFNQTLAAGSFVLAAPPTVTPIWDPDVYLSAFVTGSPQNYGKFSDAKVDDLFKRQSQEVDPTKRRALVWDLQRRLQETVPSVVYVHRVFTHGAHYYIRNYEGPRPMLYDNLRFDDVWIER